MAVFLDVQLHKESLIVPLYVHRCYPPYLNTQSYSSSTSRSNAVVRLRQTSPAVQLGRSRHLRTSCERVRRPPDTRRTSHPFLGGAPANLKVTSSLHQVLPRIFVIIRGWNVGVRPGRGLPGSFPRGRGGFFFRRNGVADLPRRSFSFRLHVYREGAGSRAESAGLLKIRKLDVKRDNKLDDRTLMGAQ